MDSHNNARTTAYSRAEIAQRADRGVPVATIVGVSPATVSRTLQRLRLNKLSALQPPRDDRDVALGLQCRPTPQRPGRRAAREFEQLTLTGQLP